jgi:arylsulfatase A-like enzyme
VDLMPFLTGANKGKPHETLYWRFGQQWAIRHGDFKLVVGRDGSGKPELYDLAKDISEAKDLATAQPDKAKELQSLYDKWNATLAPAGWVPAAHAGGTKAKKKRKQP